MAKKLTPAKAKEILHDGTVHGKPITEKQRRFFGAMSNAQSGGTLYVPNPNLKNKKVDTNKSFDLKKATPELIKAIKEFKNLKGDNPQKVDEIIAVLEKYKVPKINRPDGTVQYNVHNIDTGSKKPAPKPRLVKELIKKPTNVLRKVPYDLESPSVDATIPLTAKSLQQPTTPYSFTFRDEANPAKQSTQYFPDLESWKQFTEQNPYISRDVSGDNKSAQAAGYRNFQAGGAAPIYTSDPKDPRLKAYQDSLRLSQSNISIPFGEKLFDNLDQMKKQFKGTLDWAGLVKNGEFVDDVSKYQTGIQPVDYADWNHNRKLFNTEPYTKLLYKKPVQPIVFDAHPMKGKQLSVSKSKLKQNSPNIDAGTPTGKSIEQPVTNYSVTFRDESNPSKQRTQYLPDLETWRNFTEQTGYMSREATGDGKSAQAVVYNQFAGGGTVADNGVGIVYAQDGPVAHAGPGYKGLGYSNSGYNYNSAWGGRFEMGGYLPTAQGGRQMFSPNDLRLNPEFVAPPSGAFKIPATDVERYAAQKAKEAPATVKPTPKGRSAAAQAWVENAYPMTALGYKMKGQPVPQNFEKGEINPYDQALATVNPFRWAHDFSNTGEDLAQGNYTQAAFDAASVLPFLSEAKGIAPGLGMLGQDAKQAGKYLNTQTPFLANRTGSNSKLLDLLNTPINPVGILSDYTQGFLKGTAEQTAGALRELGVLKGTTPRRPFFETFPITKAQKAKVMGMQDEAFAKAKQFTNDYWYSNSEDVRPVLQDKMREILPELKLANNVDNFEKGAGPFNMVKDKLIPSTTWGKGREGINKEVLNYLNENRGSVGGVNVGDVSLTLRNSGNYYVTPKDISRIAAHEAGHTAQKFGYYKFTPSKNPNDLHDLSKVDWDNQITNYNPEYGYYTSNPDTELGRRFQKALVDPKKGKTNTGNYTKETWLSAPSELHSDLMASKYNMYEQGLRKGLSHEEMMNRVTNPQGKDLEWLLNDRHVKAHFKKETPLKEKLDLIKILPAAVPGVAATAVAAQQSQELPEKQMGGGLSGAGGFMYARTGPTYKDKKQAGGMLYYEHGEDWKTKGMKSGGSVREGDARPMFEELPTAYVTAKRAKKDYKELPQATVIGKTKFVPPQAARDNTAAPFFLPNGSQANASNLGLSKKKLNKNLPGYTDVNLDAFDALTDYAQFIPGPAGKLAEATGVGIDAYQAYDAFKNKRPIEGTVNTASALLPFIPKSTYKTLGNILETGYDTYSALGNSQNYYAKGGKVPVSARGLYDHPGQMVDVPTPDGSITMKSIGYPVYGVDNTGQGQMMYPEGEYQFQGDMVRETPIAAGGKMIKRADGSYSRHGLWDSIRENKGSGKKPTKEMLKQERKIKAKEMEMGGVVAQAGVEIPVQVPVKPAPAKKSELDMVLEAPSKFDSNKNFHDLVKEVATEAKIDPRLLWSSSFVEGMNLAALKPNKVSNAYLDAHESDRRILEYPVDGFYNYGLDNFGDTYPELVKRGYLPENFDYFPYKTTNEQHRPIKTAAFKNNKDAILAKAAYLKYEGDRVKGYANKHKVSLTPDEQAFFTMAAYNGGLGSAQAMLDDLLKSGLSASEYIKRGKTPKGQVYKNVKPRYDMMSKVATMFEAGGEIKTIQDKGQLRKLDQLTNFTNYNYYE